MGEVHSAVKIKRTDGTTRTLTFKDLLAADEGTLVEQVHRLEEYLSADYGLRKYHATILAQRDELKTAWDEGHTLELRKAMDRCAEELDEAIQRFEVTLKDLILLVGARRSVGVWLSENPAYNHVYKYGSTTYYYCKKRGGGPGRYENQVLNYPAS